jgi:thiol-disulfide isomerase/thioredoxin
MAPILDYCCLVLIGHRAAVALLLFALAGCSTVSIGDPARRLRLRQVDGTWLSLDDLRGRVVMVEFTATWCPACSALRPSLEAIAAQESQLEWVVVNVGETRFRVVAYLRDHALPATARAVIDEPGDSAFAWDAAPIPTVFLLDRKGIVRFVSRGYSVGLPSELRAAVRRLIANESANVSAAATTITSTASRLGPR